MSTKSRLDKLYKNCSRIRLPEDSKILFISDLHMGDGGPEDDFVKNDAKFCDTIESWNDANHYLILLGDIWDSWECPQEEKILIAHKEVHEMLDFYRPANRLFQLQGNHDNKLDFPQAIVLQIGDIEIFCAHGHQGDFFNDRGWWIGQNVVRYLWVPLQWIGLHDAQRREQKRHEQQEKRLVMWANDQPFISIFGHTHLLADIGKYKNAGSWVRMGGEGIEFSNGNFIDKHF